jgi:hypothetical protein
MRTDYPLGYGDAAMEAVGFRKIPGMIQMVMAVWVPEEGWLHTKRGITACGPIKAQPVGEDAVVLEAKSGYRAIQHRLEAVDAVGK